MRQVKISTIKNANKFFLLKRILTQSLHRIENERS